MMKFVFSLIALFGLGIGAAEAPTLKIRKIRCCLN